MQPMVEVRGIVNRFGAQVVHAARRGFAIARVGAH